MSSLFEAFRHSPTPAALESREALADAIKRAHIQLMSRSAHLTDDIQSQTMIPELRAYALYLEELFRNGGRAERLLPSLAADLYEFAGALAASEEAAPANAASDGATLFTRLFVPPLVDYVRACTVAQQTDYGAQARVLSDRILDQIASLEPAEPSSVYSTRAIKAVVSFFGHNYRAAFNHACLAFAELQPVSDYLVAADATNIQRIIIDSEFVVCRSIIYASAAAILGDDDLLDLADFELSRAEEAQIGVQAADHIWLSDSLRTATSGLADSSTWRILREAGLEDRVAREFVRQGVLELWGPQEAAVRGGLLEAGSGRKFALSIPTGSGKTLLAQLALASALGSAQGWALYIAPTRALVGQVSSDLRISLRRLGIDVRTVVAGAEQSTKLEDELSQIRERKGVTVTTPEKLDAYMRAAGPGLFEDCRLLVVDEAHKVGDATRGALLESLIARFLALLPNVGMLLMSGVMSNAEEFADWLGDPDGALIVSEQRATRQMRALAVETNRTEKPPKNAKRKGRTVSVRQVDFTGGLLVVEEGEDLNPPLTVHLPDVFSGRYHERFFGGGRWSFDPDGAHTSTPDHGRMAAEALAVAPGTVLVFVQQIASAERCCRECKIAHTGFPDEREELAVYLESELGGGHDLASHVRRGVAYHHARLPSNVQRAIELGLERGWLKVVFATPTLREGINSSVTAVVVAGTERYDPLARQMDQMAEVDFANLAGRAGRPYIETEGRVVLIPDSLARSTAIQTGKQYILENDAALRVKSQLDRWADRMNAARGSLTEMAAADQALALALGVSDDSDPEGHADKILASTLWARQSKPQQTVTRTAAKLAQMIDKSRADVGPEKLGLAARMGISLSSAVQLYAILEEHKGLFDIASTMPDRKAQLLALLGATLQTPEFRKGLLEREVSPSAHADPLATWMSGGTYGDILTTARDSGALPTSATAGLAVKYVSDLSTWLSWGFSTAGMAIETMVVDADPYVTALPLLVRYGLPSLSSCYVALSGVSDRAAAQDLGERFDTVGELATIGAVRRWLDSIAEEIEDMFPVEKHSLRAQLLRQGLFRRDRIAQTLQEFAFVAQAPVKKGQLVTASGGSAILRTIGSLEPIGELGRPLSDSPDHVSVGIVLGDVSGRDRGVIAVALDGSLGS